MAQRVVWLAGGGSRWVVVVLVVVVAVAENVDSAEVFIARTCGRPCAQKAHRISISSSSSRSSSSSSSSNTAQCTRTRTPLLMTTWTQTSTAYFWHIGRCKVALLYTRPLHVSSSGDTSM
jgi:hypothetical protein